MKNWKKVLAAVLMSALAVTTMTGCGSKEQPAPAAQAQPSDGVEAPANETADAGDQAETAPAELREVNVVLDWYPNAIHTFLYTAMERGYFAEEGLKVNVQFPTNTNDAMSLVAAGRAEFGMYYPHDVIQAVGNQGVGVKSIGAIAQGPLDIILSLKDKNITSPADLVGKKIGYSGTALSEAFVKSMIQHEGGSVEDVTLTDVGFELMSAMTTGNVDATIGCMVNHEVPQMEEEGFELNYFFYTNYGVPDYYAEVMLTSNKILEEEPELAQSFLRACQRGYNDFAADPYGCLEILLNNQNEENFPLSETVEKQSCDALLPVMQTEEAPFLTQTADMWQATIDWMAENGLVENVPTTDDVMVNLIAWR